jgi:hypothetical protein
MPTPSILGRIASFFGVRRPARKEVTAAEFLADLERDPQYQEMRQQRDAAFQELQRQCAEDERSVVEELNAAGFKVTSVYDLVNNAPHPFLPRNFIGPYEAAYPILLRHLSEPHIRNIRFGIIRALTVRDLPEDGKRLLLEKFRSEQDRAVRWHLANACLVALGARRCKAHHPEIREAFRAGVA